MGDSGATKPRGAYKMREATAKEAATFGTRFLGGPPERHDLGDATFATVELRVDSQGSGEVADGVVAIALVQVRDAATVVGSRVLRIDLDGPRCSRGSRHYGKAQ